MESIPENFIWWGLYINVFDDTVFFKTIDVFEAYGKNPFKGPTGKNQWVFIFVYSSSLSPKPVPPKYLFKSLKL